MNSVIDAIISRRAVRTFADKQIASENLELILKCAQYAPSGMNRQANQFTVLSGSRILDEFLSEVKKDIEESDSEFWKSRAKNPNFNFFYKAPTFVIVSSNPEANALTPTEDAAVAIENMMIAAKSLGISSCWIHTLCMIGAAPNTRRFLEQYGLPQSHKIYGSVALGYNSSTEPSAHSIVGNKIVFAK